MNPLTLVIIISLTLIFYLVGSCVDGGCCFIPDFQPNI